MRKHGRRPALAIEVFVANSSASGEPRKQERLRPSLGNGLLLSSTWTQVGGTAFVVPYSSYHDSHVARTPSKSNGSPWCYIISSIPPVCVEDVNRVSPSLVLRSWAGPKQTETCHQEHAEPCLTPASMKCARETTGRIAFGCLVACSC